jgi:hypothetical protein
MTRTWLRALWVMGLWAGFLGGCGGTQDCSNGECSCAPGAQCEFECDAPPCHVTCEGSNPSCHGECGNGTCTCGESSSCDFDCKAGPCHVDCEGNNASCEGTCANGTCHCGTGSSCEFECLDDNCKFNCDGACVVDCSEDGKSKANCAINSCALGDVVTCPDGLHLSCGAACPVTDDGDQDG